MKMFKTSVRGFKKSDVNNYIIELNRDFSDIKANYEHEITELKLKLSEAEEQLEKSRSNEERLEASFAENSRLNSENSSLKASLDALTESYNNVEEEKVLLENKLLTAESERTEFSCQLTEKDQVIRNLSSELTASNEIIASQNEKIANYEKELNDVRNSFTENKEKLAEMVSCLKNSQEEIETVNSRNAELESLIRQTTAKLLTYESERATSTERELVTKKARKADAALMSAATSVTSSVNEAVVESAESCLKEFQQFADKVQFTSKNAISELADEYSLLVSRAAYYCDVLDSNTKKTLSEFKGKANAICNDLKKDT